MTPEVDPLWQITIRGSDPPDSDPEKGLKQKLGRIITEARDGGILLEERSGQLQTLKPADIENKVALDQKFSRFSFEEMGRYLQDQTGSQFTILSTDHYVICSAGNAEYSRFAGGLLEKVYSEFHSFFAESAAIRLRQSEGPLPVIILSNEKDFQEFASRQHPEVNFEDTPGYYSVRENIILLRDPFPGSEFRTSSELRRQMARIPRQISTIVHEAVHQLAFNSGLQTRMADNPVWLSEGLALWFEPPAAKSPLLWSKPGQVNAVLQPAFAKFERNRKATIPLADLLQNDQAFLDPATMPVAYAESWGLVSWLIRHERQGFDRFLLSVGSRKPLIQISPEERLLEFEQSIQKSLNEIERSMISYAAKLRIPRQ